MNLYEINQEILNCVKMPSGDIVNTDTGEVVDTEYLDNLEMERDMKIENTALFIKNLLSNAEQIKAEIVSLDKRMKQEKAKAEALKNYLENNLNGTGFETPKVKISYRSSKAVDTDEDFIEWAKKNAPQFLKFKEPDVDKTGIKKALSDGAVLEHARIVEKNNIQIK